MDMLEERQSLQHSYIIKVSVSRDVVYEPEHFRIQISLYILCLLSAFAPHKRDALRHSAIVNERPILICKRDKDFPALLELVLPFAPYRL
jgi:hypothetical protein